MYCSQCGTRIPEGDAFCPSCRTAVVGSSHAVGSPGPDEIIAENLPQKVKQVSSAIPLAEGETILWHKESTQGLIHKEVVMEEAVTNRRCLKYDVKNKQIVAQVGLNHHPEVVVMNVHRVNDSVGGGVFLTPRMFGFPGLGGFGVYGGPRRGVSQGVR
jgi:hypothetical protein